MCESLQNPQQVELLHKVQRLEELEAENAALRAELQAAVVTVNSLTNYCELCKNEGCGLTMRDCIKYWRGVWAKSAKGGE